MSEAPEDKKVLVGERLIQALLSPDYFELVLDIFKDSTSVASIVDVFDCTDYSDLVKEVFGNLTNEEVKDLFRPALPDALRRFLGAQSVIITW